MEISDREHLKDMRKQAVEIYRGIKSSLHKKLQKLQGDSKTGRKTLKEYGLLLSHLRTHHLGFDYAFVFDNTDISGLKREQTDFYDKQGTQLKLSRAYSITLAAEEAIFETKYFPQDGKGDKIRGNTDREISGEFTLPTPKVKSDGQYFGRQKGDTPPAKIPTNPDLEKLAGELFARGMKHEDGRAALDVYK